MSCTRLHAGAYVHEKCNCSFWKEKEKDLESE